VNNSDQLLQIRSGMHVIAADGTDIGTVWQLHLRDTEAVIEVRPKSRLRAFLNVFALREMQPNSDHLFLPGADITQVVSGKHVRVQLDSSTARACVSRPPWIEPERKGWNSNGMG
jgi:hypothetical protein